MNQYRSADLPSDLGGCFERGAVDQELASAARSCCTAGFPGPNPGSAFCAPFKGALRAERALQGANTGPLAQQSLGLEQRVEIDLTQPPGAQQPP